MLRAKGPFFLDIPPLRSVHDIGGFRYDPLDGASECGPITPSQVNAEWAVGPLRYAIVQKLGHPVGVVPFKKTL